MKENESVKSLMVWIPAELHNLFKQKVAGQGRTVKNVIISFLEAYVGKGPGRNSKDSGSASSEK